MRISKSVIWTAVLLGSLVAVPDRAAAAQDVWFCTLKTARNSFVMKEIVVAVDEAAGTAIVNDALIQHLIGTPVAARVTGNDAKQTRLKWVVKGIPATATRTATVNYRATLTKASGRISVTAQPQGADNTFLDSGTCARQK